MQFITVINSETRKPECVNVRHIQKYRASKATLGSVIHFNGDTMVVDDTVERITDLITDLTGAEVI